MDFLRKLFDNNERDIRKYRKVVDKVNALEPQFTVLTDEQLKAKTAEFRQRVKDAVGDEEQYKDKSSRRAAYDKALDAILPEAFAACREASRRTLNMRHFDVQLIGGMVQHDGRISELRTGEGKTLTCTLATYLNAIAGKGVHVVTANDYLVKRDAVWMGPLFHALGMTVGILQGHSPETGEGGGTFLYDPTYEDPSVDGLDERFKHSRMIYNRREAYDCDILYATSSELGFDYLRDNMAPTIDHMVQHRGHWFAIIDECDSNLIDEARTPLIISGTAEKSSELYYVMAKIVPTLEKGEAKKDKYDTTTDEKDYTVDEKAKSATFTESGMEKVERALREIGHEVEDISSMENLEYMQHAVAALKAHGVFEKDIDYVVKPNQEGKPEIVIVDESTGRLMFGRRWSDGLHQAVEAKEGIKIENEQQTLATITIQNYFRLYAKLAGMTGTAKTEEDEFRKIYALDVVQVPTNKPMVRKDLADVIYKTLESKLRGIAGEVLLVHCRQQPLLVGTRSIEMSEVVSRRLTFQGLELLAAVTVLRTRLEAKRKELGDGYAPLSAVLNKHLEELTVPALAPVAKAVGIEKLRVQSEEFLTEYAAILGLDKALPETVKALSALNKQPESELEKTLIAEQRAALKEALEYGIPHNVLNAKYHEQEARIIAEAGRKSAVTIATNMAGRGVDILLGGTHYKDLTGGSEEKEQDYSYRRGGRRGGVAHVVTGKDKTADPETMGPAGAGTIVIDEEREAHDIAQEREEVRALGGLYILGTERHESRRIDNQLRGRAGRQGDPGTSKFHVSLEDYLWRVFGDRSNSIMMRAWEEDQSVDMPLLSKMIERAQKKVEQHHFDGRKHVLEYDDVHNVQREVIYKERRRILENTDLRDTLLSYLHEAVVSMVELHCPDGVPMDEWNREALYNDLNQQFPLANFVALEELSNLTKPELVQKLSALADEAYESKEEELAESTVPKYDDDGTMEMIPAGTEMMRDIERHFMRQSIDQAWIEHLKDMDYLREGIGLRGYAQVDPLVAYKKEAMELFSQLQSRILGDTVRQVFMAQVQQETQYQNEPSIYDLLQQFGGDALSMGLDEEDAAEALPSVDPEVNALLAAAAAAAQQAPAVQRKIDPNDPCPCGSGKKYKQCHRGKPLPEGV